MSVKTKQEAPEMRFGSRNNNQSRRQDAIEEAARQVVKEWRADDLSADAVGNLADTLVMWPGEFDPNPQMRRHTEMMRLERRR